MKTLSERGLDFADLQYADWTEALTVEDSRDQYGEIRYVSLVPLDARLCVVAWCWRGGNMRIISLRKANAREVRIYDQS
ncbi:BrnT family toxin [Pseudooceanicola sp.]|uniref:BrnT family toxin n=1 Tax=Pseudooceanicola sp. TaxID=1914328 RepID=UPI0035C75557